MCFFSIMGNVSWVVLVLDISLYYTDLAICLKVFLIPSFSLCFNICINITFNLAFVECDQVQLAPFLIRYNKYFCFPAAFIVSTVKQPHSIQTLLNSASVNTFLSAVFWLRWPPVYRSTALREVRNGRTTSRYGRQLIMTRYRQAAAENRQTRLCNLVSGGSLGTMNIKQLWNGTQDADFGRILCNRWWNHLNDMCVDDTILLKWSITHGRCMVQNGLCKYGNKYSCIIAVARNFLTNNYWELLKKDFAPRSERVHLLVRYQFYRRVKKLWRLRESLTVFNSQRWTSSPMQWHE